MVEPTDSQNQGLGLALEVDELEPSSLGTKSYHKGFHFYSVAVLAFQNFLSSSRLASATGVSPALAINAI